MFAKDRAKELGCGTLAQVARVTEASTQTLNNWFNFKPELFDCVCLGVAIKLQQKREEEENKET